MTIKTAFLIEISKMVRGSYAGIKDIKSVVWINKTVLAGKKKQDVQVQSV